MAEYKGWIIIDLAKESVLDDEYGLDVSKKDANDVYCDRKSRFLTTDFWTWTLTSATAAIGRHGL